ncbi:hypothetical protein BGZ47_005747 [Haplosporangium gracile]|nr:hypothetical protein BGZ47_005747 [Haplosporangium gracile]
MNNNQPLLDDEEEGKESEGCVERDEQLDAGIMERSPGRTSPIKSRFDDDNGLGNNSANIYYKFGPRTYSTENSGALSPALQYGQMDPRPAGSQQSETMHWEPQQEQSLRVQHFLEQTNQGGVLEECESLKDKTDISGISTVAIINMTGDQLKVMNAQVQTIQDLMSDVVGLKIVDVTRSQEIKNFSDLVAGLREEMDKLRERDTNKELLGEIAGLKKELAQLRDQDMKRELSDEIADLKKEVVQLKNQGVRRDDLDEMTSLKKEVAQLKGQGVRHAFDLRRMSREVDDKYAFFQDEMLKLVDK